MKKSSNKMVVVTDNQPPPPAPDYADFDGFLARGRQINRDWKRLRDCLTQLEKAEEKYEDYKQWRDLHAVAGPIVDDRERLKADFVRWEVERKEVFDPDSLYDQIQGVGWQLKRTFVDMQIGLLVGSFPNAGPHNPEIYVGMLSNEILAARPSAIMLERTCRTLRRSKNFVPTIKEVLETLDASDGLADMPDEASDFDWLFDEIKAKIAGIRSKLEADEVYQHEKRMRAADGKAKD